MLNFAVRPIFAVVIYLFLTNTCLLPVMFEGKNDDIEKGKLI